MTSGSWPNRTTRGLWLEPVPGGFLLIQQELGSGHLRYWLYVRAYDATGGALGETLIVHASRQPFRGMATAHDERGLFVLRPWPAVLERYSINEDGSVAHEVLREWERTSTGEVVTDGSRVVALVYPRGVGSTRGKIPPMLWADGTERAVTEPARPCLRRGDIFLDGDSLAVLRTIDESSGAALCSVSLEGELQTPATVIDTATPLPEQLRDRVLARVESGFAAQGTWPTGIALRTMSIRSRPLARQVITTDAFLDFAFTWTGERFIFVWTNSTPGSWRISSASLTCSGELMRPAH